MVSVLALVTVVVLVAGLVLASTREQFRPRPIRTTLTWYESWPKTGSREATHFNGDTWAGMFAGLKHKMSRQWVARHNIVAVHSADWPAWRFKLVRITWNGRQIDGAVLDFCADGDVTNPAESCTAMKTKTGFMVDLEKNMANRLGFNGMGVGTIQAVPRPNWGTYLRGAASNYKFTPADVVKK